MRFFSNDAREASDEDAKADEAEAGLGDHPDRVQSEPVAVPVQRPASASPWAASPGTVPDRPGAVGDRGPDAVPVDGPGAPRAGDADAELADREAADRTAVTGSPIVTGAPIAGARPLDADRRDDVPPGLDTGGRPPFHEPAPQDTAFGAATVGGAVAASARANPLDDDRRTDERPADDTGAGDAPTDGAALRAEASRADDAPRAGTGPTVASPTEANTSSWDGPGTAPATTATGEQSGAHRIGSGPDADGDIGRDDRTDRDDRDVEDLALEDGGTFADPVVVEKDGDARAFAGGAATSTSTVTTADDVTGSGVPGTATTGATGGGMPTEQLPGTVAAPELGPLFADADAHAFRDRWRDVQLRFVDDPKAAAGDAATLVDEAVDALAAGLRSQKEQLAGSSASDDTEQLRVRIRTYRDFLDRLLAL